MSGVTLFLAQKVFDPIESGLLYVGIDSAFKAGVVFGVITAGIYWAAKPASAFDKTTGEPRPWALLECGDTKLEPTYVPWYIGSALTGYAVNLII
jgi:hypothetical protein